MTSCYVGANQRGRWGEQNRAENEQIQRQGKQSKRSSEVRTQRHCVRTTIEADPTATTGPSSENTAAARAHILTAQNQSSWRSRPAWRKICFHVKLNVIIKQTKKKSSLPADCKQCISSVVWVSMIKTQFQFMLWQKIKLTRITLKMLIETNNSC